MNTSEQELRDLFSKYGQIRNLKMKKPQIWNSNIQQMGATTSYGIAYIDFLKEEDAQKAMTELNGTQFGSHHLQIEFYEKKAH